MNEDYHKWLKEQTELAISSVKCLINKLLKLHPEYKEWVAKNFKEYL